MSCLLLGAGTALAGLQLAVILRSTDVPLPGEKTDSPKHKAVLSGAGTFLVGTQSHSQQPFLSLCSPRTGEAASWVVLTLRNWVGPGEPFGLGQASSPWSLPGNSI